ncbi:hypothetical protein LB505_011357 [Fusarium chuoi]|nr:hypothetical protein LB505_011357 [Fusarium chuoi]
MFFLEKYGPEVQRVSADAPIQDIIALLKRDGGVFVKGLIPEADVDKAYDECRARLDSDVEWSGSFFPSKGDATGAKPPCSQPYIRPIPGHEPSLPASRRSFPHYAKLVLVGS